MKSISQHSASAGDESALGLIGGEGRLNDRVILRFAHVINSGGGMERYLEDLDNALLKRSRAKIILLRLSGGAGDEKTVAGSIGLGCRIEIPLTGAVGDPKGNTQRGVLTRWLRSRIRPQTRDLIIYNPILYRAVFRRLLRGYSQQGRVVLMKSPGDKLKTLCDSNKVDLLVMHNIGSSDCREIIDVAVELGIPFVFINHYANDRFNDISVREQLLCAKGIAGVNGIDIPKRLSQAYINLSDGIDTDFFSPDSLTSAGDVADTPIILYPARILRVKGQADLIEAAGRLKAKNITARVVLAGRTDDREYEQELRCRAKELGMKDSVLFVGELNATQLRKWYHRSTIVAFPTYHQEGLGRITIEAQAMKVPPVAYIIGGTPEGIIDGKTGYLVQKGDLVGFTERLVDLLTDSSKRAAMGEAGRKFVVKQFSLESLAARHEQFYLAGLGIHEQCTSVY